MVTVRDVTYELLRARGLTTIFGNPGSNELPFLAGMPDDFRYVLGLHEGAVLAMADGYAQARGGPALVNLHAAAGTGNALGALTNSVYSHSPLVLTAGQQVRSTIGQEVMLANVDAASLPRPLVKWSCEPASAQDVPRAFSHAIHLAQLPPRGPVYLSIPYDDWAAEAPASADHLLARRTEASGALRASLRARLGEALDAARSPALVLGPEADTEQAWPQSVRLAERLGAAVWIAPSAARCPFPTRHPAFRGVLPAAVRGVSEALTGRDLVLVAGAPVFRYHEHVPGEYLPEGARLIQLTGDAGEAARAPMGEAVVCDVGEALAQLAEALGPASAAEPAVRDFAHVDTSGPQVHPAAVFATLRDATPDDVVHVVESTSTSSAYWGQADLRRPGSYYFPASGGLGFGLPAAVGVQLAHDERGDGRRVVGLIGDGSANYGITALWTAVQYRVPVIIVILKNGTYGALRWFAGVLGAGETSGLDVPGIDFVQLARGYGVPATAVSDADAFGAMLKEAFDTDGPVLIEVETQRTAPS